MEESSHSSSHQSSHLTTSLDYNQTGAKKDTLGLVNNPLLKLYSTMGTGMRVRSNSAFALRSPVSSSKATVNPPRSGAMSQLSRDNSSGNLSSSSTNSSRTGSRITSSATNGANNSNNSNNSSRSSSRSAATERQGASATACRSPPLHRNTSTTSGSVSSRDKQSDGSGYTDGYPCKDMDMNMPSFPITSTAPSTSRQGSQTGGESVPLGVPRHRRTKSSNHAITINTIETSSALNASIRWNALRGDYLPSMLEREGNRGASAVLNALKERLKMEEEQRAEEDILPVHTLLDEVVVNARLVSPVIYQLPERTPFFMSINTNISAESIQSFYDSMDPLIDPLQREFAAMSG
jgi:hypothetical protein